MQKCTTPFHNYTEDFRLLIAEGQGKHYMWKLCKRFVHILLRRNLFTLENHLQIWHKYKFTSITIFFFIKPLIDKTVKWEGPDRGID